MVAEGKALALPGAFLFSAPSCGWRPRLRDVPSPASRENFRIVVERHRCPTITLSNRPLPEPDLQAPRSLSIGPAAGADGCRRN